MLNFAMTALGFNIMFIVSLLNQTIATDLPSSADEAQVHLRRRHAVVCARRSAGHPLGPDVRGHGSPHVQPAQHTGRTQAACHHLRPQDQLHSW